MNPLYIDQQLHMSWPLICQTACQALIRKVTFDELVAEAVRLQTGRVK